LLDSGYVDADLLVTAQTQYQIDVVGPPYGSYSRQRLEGHGYDLQAFVIDWEAEHARCPQGQRSVKWTPGQDVSGDPVVRIRFDRATCRVCPTRQACTCAKDAPCQLTVRPKAHPEAIHTARQRQETTEFKEKYALRSGVESSLSQGTRRFELRRSRYIGLVRTHLQQLLNATAMHVARVMAW
jgi:transposase